MTETDGQISTDGAAAPAAAERVLAWLGPESLERPTPSLLEAFAGIGGLMVGAGVLIASVGDHPSRSKVAAMGSLLTVVAWVARRFVNLAVVKSMAVGVALVGIPALALAATVSNNTDSFWTGGLLAVLFLAAWALPGFKNRNLFLAIGAIALVGAFGSLSSPAGPSAQSVKCDQYLQNGDMESYDAECTTVQPVVASTGILPVRITDNVGAQGTTYLVGAALFLGLTWWLDRRGRRGTATALSAAGLITAFTGTALLVNKLDGSNGGVFVTIIGLLVCVVGSHGARRATTWWGAVMSSAGVVWVVAWQWKPGSTTSDGGVAITVGLLLVAVALAAAAIKAGQRSAAPPTPPAEAAPAPDQ